MKPFFLAASFSMCQALSALSADLDKPAACTFYLNVNPGVAWMQPVSFSDPNDSGKLQFNPGPTLNLAGGYNFTETLSCELETGALFLFHSNTRFNGVEDVHDDLLQIPVMANLRYRIPLHSRFHPFVGAGVGGVHTQMYDVEGIAGINTTSVGSDFTFGYQAFAGCRYQISPVVELGLEYKFVGTLEQTLGDLHMGETRTHSGAVSISLRF